MGGDRSGWWQRSGDCDRDAEASCIVRNKNKLDKKKKKLILLRRPRAGSYGGAGVTWLPPSQLFVLRVFLCFGKNRRGVRWEEGEDGEQLRKFETRMKLERGAAFHTPHFHLQMEVSGPVRQCTNFSAEVNQVKH